MISEQVGYGRTLSSPRIAYAYYGDGEQTIFFLHGIGGNKKNWLDQLRYFGDQGYRAIAWDIRGYGDSDDYEGAFDFEKISADLIRLMDELAIDKAHFVGLSMGGRILMDFAYRYAHRINHLVICAAFPSFGKALSAQQRENYIKLRKQPLLQGQSFAELAPALITSLVGNDVPDSVYQSLYGSICELRKDSYLKALEAAVFFDRRDEIQNIRNPTLLLYAENDRLTPPDMGQQVAALMPHAQITILPNSGHLMNLEVSDLFNQVVQQFIQADIHD